MDDRISSVQSLPGVLRGTICHSQELDFRSFSPNPHWLLLPLNQFPSQERRSRTVAAPCTTLSLCCVLQGGKPARASPPFVLHAQRRLPLDRFSVSLILQIREKISQTASSATSETSSWPPSLPPNPHWSI